MPTSTSVSAFDPADLPAEFGELASKKWIEVSVGSKLYDLLVRHIAEHSVGTQSYAAEVVKGSKLPSSCPCGPAQQTCTKSKTSRVRLTIGCGIFQFSDFGGNRLIAIHQAKGDPVGTQCGVEQLKNLIIVTDGSESDLAAFLSDLVEASEVTEQGIIDIYNFNSRCRYWRSSASIKARPLDSVILPQRIKSQVISDLGNFLCDDMRIFYETHGIPYRRSYLLYGVPGTGKTSFIQAIAGYCSRSISYLQVDPEMTDVILRSAMDSLPEETVVVIEDIDALFDKNRVSKTSKSNLTFSGLLNALDGVGCSSGQIFILTTNLRDQLDSALIRKGRVDVQVFFDHAEDEQIAQMWRSFYPAAAGSADEFVAAVRAELKGKPLTTAELQHFFVLQMRMTPAEALANAHIIADELREKEAESARAAAASAAESAKPPPPNAAAAAAAAAAGDGAVGDGEGSGTTGGAVHRIHLHLHTDEKVAVSVVRGPEAADRAVTPEDDESETE